MDRKCHTCHARRQDIKRSVASYEGDTAGLDPRRYRRMDARRGLNDVPRSEFVTSRPTTRPKEDGVAGCNSEARFLFPCFEVLDVNRSTRVEVRQILQARNVQHDAASDDAVF